MLRKFHLLFALAFVVLATANVRAFSLLGPLDAHAWQTPELGYNPRGFDIGNPMNLGEEYRWNTRIITYAYDQSFLNYFGQQGVDAIEQAIAIFNELPRASDINLDDYPTDNRRFNDLAANLGIMDIKSQTMSLLLEVLGLAQPERWVYGLRSRREETIGGVTFTNYTVIQRNFDPDTLEPTNRVNDTFYRYFVLEFENPDYADAIEFLFDPLAFEFTSVAGGLLFPGQTFPGLTRDDVGGWRYLHRANNYNVEQLPLNVFPFTNQVGVGLGASSNVPPWTPILTGTNLIFGTNFFGNGSPPWTPFLPGTNVSTNVFTTNLTNILIDIALRPGVEKIRFVRRNFDSLLGNQFRPYTNVYSDIVISNFSRVTQRIQRVVTQPDLIFGAEDLGLTGDDDPEPILVGRGINRINNDAINGNTAQGGPGVLRPPIVITFTDILPVFREVAGPNLPVPGGPDPFDPFDPTSTLFFFSRSVVWGSFDATDADPIVFPNGLSLQELEDAVER